MRVEELSGTHNKFFIIQMNLPTAGFGAVLLTTLNQFRYCERNNYYPIIGYDDTCDIPFFDKRFGNNLWEQYFDVPTTYSELKKAIVEGAIAEEDCLRFSNEELIRISEEDPLSIYTYTFGRWRFNKPKDLADWYVEQRTRGRDTVGRYVKVKDHIRRKVESFCQANFHNDFILGVHIRGTDLHYAPPVSPAEYFDHIDEFIIQHPHLKIFLATDQKQYVKVFRDRYRERLFFSDSFRSDNEIAPFNRTEISPYKKGEDVLLDILLLSKTDYLLKGASNVGEFAMYFNPELKCRDLSFMKEKAYGQDYGHGWDFINNDPAWKLLKKTNLEQVSKHASSQSPIQRIWMKLRYLIRHANYFLKKRLM